jgi:hypothetical protein
MKPLLGFMPFIAFAIGNRVAGSIAGLAAGAIVSLILLALDWFVAGRSLKILDIGSALLFGGLLLYSLIAKPAWSVIVARLCVDMGLLLIVLASMAVGQPFTMQYAREQVGREFWGSSTFRHINYVITGVWALALAVIVAAEVVLLYAPGVPTRAGILVIVLALVGAVKFTGWYPGHVKARAGTNQV